MEAFIFFELQTNNGKNAIKDRVKVNLKKIFS